MKYKDYQESTGAEPPSTKSVNARGPGCKGSASGDSALLVKTFLCFGNQPKKLQKHLRQRCSRGGGGGGGLFCYPTAREHSINNTLLYICKSKCY